MVRRLDTNTMDSITGSFLHELYSKHRNSTQAESMHLCAVMTAVVDLIQSQGLAVSPTSVFAAAMSSLDDDSSKDPTITAALCTLLMAALQRVPTGVLQAKFGPATAALCSIVERSNDDAAPLKGALSCLGVVVAALDPTNWPLAARPFQVLLAYVLDLRPKVRKRAQSGVQAVFAAIQPTPAIGAASDAVLKLSQQVLPGPEAAARAAAAASAKKRGDAEKVLAQAVANALHLLGTLTLILPVLSSSAVAAIAQLLQKLYFLQQPLLSRHSTAALAALCASSQVPPEALSALLAALLDNSAAWQAQDADTALSLGSLMETGLIRLKSMDAAAAERLLPATTHVLVGRLSAAQEGVRLASARSLIAIIQTCLDEAAISRASAQTLGGRVRGTPPGIVGLIAGIADALGSQHMEAWPHALPVASALFQRLGPNGAVLAPVLLQRVGDLCAGAADEALNDDSAVLEDLDADQRDQRAKKGVAGQARGAMAAALAGLGPQAVLAVLPLDLDNEESEPRQWLLPLMRQHVRGADLAYWATQILPLARGLGNQAAALAASDQLLALQCQSLEAQLWDCLPAFADAAPDLAEAFRAHAQTLGLAFQKREDLRRPICTALQRMCLQTRASLQAAGEAEGVGHSEPPAGATNDDSDDEGPAAGAAADGPYPPEAARKNLAALRAFSKNWLPLLFNAYLAMPAAQLAPLERAISALAAVAEPAAVASFFRTVVQKLIKVTQDAKADLPPPDALQEGGDTPGQRRCTFMNLALALLPGLDDRALGVLCSAALPALQEREQAVQKRAYKLMATVCEQRRTYLRAHIQEVLDALLAGLPSALPAAKRHRLRCLRCVVVLLQSPGAPSIQTQAADPSSSPQDGVQQVVSALVGEIVLCTKEVNQKTRAAAFALLVDLARAMHAASPLPHPGAPADAAMGEGPETPQGGLPTLMAMVMGGLVATTPHMVSACVMALARLLFEFAGLLEQAAPQLLETVLMLLRSKSREIIKSVIGFCKVCAMRLPVEELQRQLPAMLQGLLAWADDSKNKFRLKIRLVLERLVRRCGMEAVEKAMPEGDKKLLTHIRKQQGRKQRLAAMTEDGEGWEDDADSAPSRATKRGPKTARTATQGQWGTTTIFGGEETATLVPSGTLRRKAGLGGSVAGRSQATTVRKQRERQGFMREAGPGGDPLDLLDTGTARRLAAGPVASPEAKPVVRPSFVREGGKLIVREDRDVIKDTADPAGTLAKGRRPGEADSDAEDEFDDLRAGGKRKRAIAGSQVGAQSTRGGRSTRTGLSKGRTSVGGRPAKSGASRGGQSMHAGDRFKARKGAAGDTKGTSKVEPYAYWPLDRKLLNRRPGKKADAAQGLARVVQGPKGGVQRGDEAKRQRRA